MIQMEPFSPEVMHTREEHEVLKSFCANALDVAPGFIELLPWPESEVLRRHCYSDHTFAEIGAALGLTPAEACLLHSHASKRLTIALESLLADLELERLSADPESILRELWQNNGLPQRH